MANRSSGGSSKLDVLQAASLVEASAFRITPKFVFAYKYKDGNKSQGLVGVRIKHANVWKHWDDLVDPEPGHPLANTVIGLIPKTYNHPSQLQPKDSSKKASDLLTKDGPSDTAEPLSPSVSKADQVAAAFAKPFDPNAEPTVSKADIQALAAGVPLGAYLKAIGFDDPEKQGTLLKNPSITGALLKQYGAGWKEQAAALGFDVPGMQKLSPEVANAASVLGYKQGSLELKALSALQQMGNDVDAVMEVAGGDDASEEDFDAAASVVNKVIAAAKKAKLITTKTSPEDEDVDLVKFKPTAAPPVPAAPPPTPAAPPVAPAPAAPPPPPPSPAAPKKPTPGFPFAVSPAISNLAYAGSAKSLGGYHEKVFLKDASGNQYLFKAASPRKAQAGAVYAAIAAEILGPGKTVPVVAGSRPELGSGTVQPMLPDVVADLSKIDLAGLNQTQLDDLMRERVMDWALSSHDTKSDNFILLKSGQVIGIDKEQAFRFIGQDSTDPSYKPNPGDLLYTKLYDLHKKKKIKLDFGAMLPAIQAIEAISDEGWLKRVDPYLQLTGNEFFPKRAAILDRKKNLRTDIEALVSKIESERTGKKGTFTFSGGWVPEGAPKKKKTPEEGGSYFQSPAGKGAIGSPVFELVTPKQTQSEPTAPPEPPIPPGYPPPPPGKMWKLQPPGELLLSGGSIVSNVKPPKDMTTGQSLPSSSNWLIKFSPSMSTDDVKDLLTKVGLPTDTVEKRSAQVVAVIDKNKWAEANNSSKPVGVLVDKPPPPPPPEVGFRTTVKFGSVPNPEATNTLDVLAAIENDKTVGYGKNINMGGLAVENQSARVIRRKASNGKTFYEVQLKIRDPYLPQFPSAKLTTYVNQRMAYNAQSDSWDAAPSTSPASQDQAGGMLKHMDPKTGSTLHIGSRSVSKYSYRGAVIANIYPQGGETVDQVLKRMLDDVKPGLGGAIVKDPTPDEEKVMKLSALYAALAPQESDKMPESERTLESLTSKLKILGITEDAMNSIRKEEVALGISVPVLPGRRKKFANGKSITHVAVGVRNPVRVVQQILGGSSGVRERLTQGLDVTNATSSESDLITGGGDYVFARVGNTSEAGNLFAFWEWGPIQMIYDPDELDRLDAFIHLSDQYGACDPKAKGGAYTVRKPLESHATRSKEVVFKRALNQRKLRKVACSTPQEAAQVIQGLKDAGITSVNGVAPEDLVVVFQTPGLPDYGTAKAVKFYDTYLKPAAE